MSKEILCACVEWVLEFGCEDEAQKYLRKLTEDGVQYTLIYYACLGRRRRRIKVRMQYRDHPFRMAAENEGRE